MPKTKSAKKVMKKFKDQYGDKAGEKIYYATANKQGRDEKTFKKEDCVKLIDDVVVEFDGSMITLLAGTVLETVSTGAIAMVPNALGDKKKKKKKKVKKEASNSQVSKLNLDY